MGPLQVRVMEETDFDYAVRLTDMAEWDFTVADFAWMKRLQPDGCLMAAVDGRRAGLATTISYGEVGWMGNVIVDPRYRSQGVGSELVRKASDYLQSRGARQIGLYSYVETAPFYEGLGFTGDIKFARLSADMGEAHVSQLPRMTPEDLSQAAALDRACFGADRSHLLQAIYRESQNRDVCYVAGEPGQLKGFVMGRITGLSAEVGPLICSPRAEHEAEKLAEAALSTLAGKRVHVGVSQNRRRLYRWLRSAGFRVDFRVLRMWLGGESPKADEAAYQLMESLERG